MKPNLAQVGGDPTVLGSVRGYLKLLYPNAYPDYLEIIGTRGMALNPICPIFFFRGVKNLPEPTCIGSEFELTSVLDRFPIWACIYYCLRIGEMEVAQQVVKQENFLEGDKLLTCLTTGQQYVLLPIPWQLKSPLHPLAASALTWFCLLELILV